MWNIFTESGIYRLLFKSTLEEKWFHIRVESSFTVSYFSLITTGYHRYNFISQSVGVAFDIVVSEDWVERLVNPEFVLSASIRLEFRYRQYSCEWKDAEIHDTMYTVGVF